MKTILPWSVLLSLAIATSVIRAEQWPPLVAPAVPDADGYVVIPGAAVAPSAKVTYRAVLDATRGGKTPADLVPAINAAGSILNDLGAGKVPAANAKLTVVFHGAAIDGILDDAHFRTKFGRTNPNLATLATLKRHGVELFVCGQNLAADHIDPATLSRDVTVASDAFLVLITYQNKGYALMPF